MSIKGALSALSNQHRTDRLNGLTKVPILTQTCSLPRILFDSLFESLFQLVHLTYRTCSERAKQYYFFSHVVDQGVGTLTSPFAPDEDFTGRQSLDTSLIILASKVHLKTSKTSQAYKGRYLQC